MRVPPSGTCRLCDKLINKRLSRRNRTDVDTGNPVIPWGPSLQKAMPVKKCAFFRVLYFVTHRDVEDVALVCLEQWAFNSHYMSSIAATSQMRSKHLCSATRTQLCCTGILGGVNYHTWELIIHEKTGFLHAIRGYGVSCYGPVIVSGGTWRAWKPMR